MVRPSLLTRKVHGICLRLRLALYGAFQFGWVGKKEQICLLCLERNSENNMDLVGRNSRLEFYIQPLFALQFLVCRAGVFGVALWFWVSRCEETVLNGSGFEERSFATAEQNEWPAGELEWLQKASRMLNARYYWHSSLTSRIKQKKYWSLSLLPQKIKRIMGWHRSSGRV